MIDSEINNINTIIKPPQDYSINQLRVVVSCSISPCIIPACTRTVRASPIILRRGALARDNFSQQTVVEKAAGSIALLRRPLTYGILGRWTVRPNA